EQIDRICESVPGGAGNIQDIYPLAPLQEGMLFHYLMQEQGDVYVEPSLIAFDHRNQLDAFLAGLQFVIDRHDILRTSMYWKGVKEPVQVVWREASLSVEECPPENTEALIDTLIQRFDQMNIRMEIDQAPLIKAFTTYDVQQDRWILSLLTHHVINDHTTLEIIVDEVLMCLKGRHRDLPEPLPFRRFIAQTRKPGQREMQEAFFHNLLSDVEETTAPYGLSQALNDSFKVHKKHVPIDSAINTRIRNLARHSGVSTASIFHLIWAQVLAVTTGRTDVVFGTVLFGRMQGGEGSDRAMGMFINTLPIRLLVNDQPVISALKNVHQLLAELLQHEHTPLVVAQNCSSLPPQQPLFTSVLNYRYDSIEEDSEFNEIEGVSIIYGEERTNYPVTVSVNDLPEGFSLDLVVDEQINLEQLAALITETLILLVETLENQSQTPVCHLYSLPTAEHNRVVHEFNQTDAIYPKDKCLHELFEWHAMNTPDAIALVHHDITMTYQALNKQANHLARWLQNSGVQREARVAIALERGFDLVIAVLATVKVGGCYVPLDLAAPDERLQTILADCQPTLLITDSDGDRFKDLNQEIISLNIKQLEQWCHGSSENLDQTLSPTNLAYIMYTSGSTGKPKGVMIEQRNIVKLAINNGYADFQETDRIACISNPAFDASTMEFWGALLNGARMIIFSHDEVLEVDRFVQGLMHHKVNAMFMTIALFNRYAEKMQICLPQLKYLMVGGETLDPRYIKNTLRQAPPENFIHVYGPTETTTFATSYRLNNIDLQQTAIPIGKPISNTRIYILNSQLKPVPTGVQGDIYISGDGVARGYLNQPEISSAAFLENPFLPGTHLYKSGDQGRWLASGDIEFLGRNDDQVKIRGFRIEPGEIESRLVHLPYVKEALVLAKKDTSGDKYLVAYCIFTDENKQQEIRKALSQVLPDYMIPSAIVPLESFPLTLNGKIDRKSLPDPQTESLTQHQYEVPSNDIEIALADIWIRILGTERVGRQDDFFELGGHSLKCVSLISEIQQSFDIDLSIRTIFENSQLTQLSDQIRHQISRIPNQVTDELEKNIPENIDVDALDEAQLDAWLDALSD
ncbi:non-ribosomal peptide synthetase, partial [Gynuella sp.]|uniref:non-ribosomal peptide synthetase n=1 Tax=Gynuella sp. TaxID=2969146 RepID=UPI003D0C1A6B